MISVFSVRSSFLGHSPGFRPVSVSALVLSCATAALPVSAQSSDEAGQSGSSYELPAIEVKGSAMPSFQTEGTGQYSTPSASVGSKGAASRKETPQSITVITRQQIEDQNLTSLDEVMAKTPGITVDQSGTAIIPAFYSRGYPVQYFQYDGVPIQTGGASWSQPDMLMFDHVEVLRGAAGLFNGAGQPGGVINLVRKRPGAEPAFRASAGLGSWNNQRIELDYSSPLNQSGSVRGRIAGAWDDRESHIDYVEGERHALYGIVESDLGERTLFTLGAGYQKRDWTPPFGGLPRYSDGGDLDLSRDTFLSTPWTYWDFETTQVFAELEHALSRNWRLKLSAVYDDETSELKYAYTRGAVDRGSLTGPMMMGGANAYDNEQLALDAYLDGRFDAFGQTHEAVLGANWYDRDARSNRGQLPGFGGTPVDVFNFHPSSIADPGAPVWGDESSTETRQKGIYGTLRLSLTDPLTVIAGGRVSWWDTRSKNLATGEVSSDYDQDHEFTPYLGLVYELTEDWAAYASYADIFEVQSNRKDVNGNSLPPVVGANYEVGIKGELMDGRLNTSLALFRIEETDRAIAVTDPIVDNCCYASDGEVRSEGVEVQVYGQLQPDWQVGAGYTYNTSEYLDDPENEGQPYRTFTPRHLLKLWTNYRLPGAWDAWSVGAGLNAQSDIYSEGGRPPVRVEQGGFAIADMRVGYRINQHWSAGLNINNLFDRKYYNRLGSANFGPATMGNVYGQPRNLMLTVRAKY